MAVMNDVAEKRLIAQESNTTILFHHRKTLKKYGSKSVLLKK